MTSETATPRTARLVSVGGLRRRILVVALLGLLGALVLAGVSLWSLREVGLAADEMASAAIAGKATLVVKADVLELNRLQSRSLLASGAGGPGPGATDDPDPRRREVVEARLSRQLADFPPLTREPSRQALEALRAESARYQSIDAAIADRLASGGPQGRADAIALSLGAATSSLSAMSEASDDLVASVETRVVASRTSMDVTTRQARIVVLVTLVVVLAAIVEVAAVIAEITRAQRAGWRHGDLVRHLPS